MVLAQFELPQSIQFLNLGWFLLHAVMIGLVFWAGFSAGRRLVVPPRSRSSQLLDDLDE